MKIIDIHTHLLYGVDDGARTIKESLFLIELAKKQYCTHIFLTPHNDCANVNLIIDTFNDLKKLSDNIFLGEEICVYDVQDIMMRLKTHDLITMNNTNYVLIEFSQMCILSHQISRVVVNMLKENYIPIIAHAERYRNIDIKDWIAIKNIGAAIQVNLFSLDSEADSKIKNMARQLLNIKLVDFIGSDSHRINHRPPNLLSGIDYILKTCDNNYADDILYKNAERYLI